MRTTIPHLAPMALAITLGCDSDPGVPAAPPGDPASVTAEEDQPRPRKAGKRTVPRPVGPLSPTKFFD